MVTRIGSVGSGMETQLRRLAVSRVGEKLIVGADFDLVGVGVNLEDVEGVGAADAEALALADGEAVDAFVMAHDYHFAFAGGGDQVAGGVGEGLVLFVQIGLEELGVAAAGDEADFLRVGLLGEVEAVAGGHLADGWLLHLSEREEGAGELSLGEAEEEVGLVLGGVGGAGENPAAAGFVEAVARVVAGGDALGADLAGGEEELIELEMVVAEGAGDGGAAGEVFADEGADDFGFETVLGVDEVVGDAEVLGYVAGVVDVVDGAAAALRNGFGQALASVIGGEAALVPELEGEADEGMSLGVQKRGDGGGIDAAGHGYCDGVLLRHKTT